ncbi:RNA 2'-phosphotransferase [Sphingomonas sp. BN140010]|uniref:Probable RNA 2'-phosphotransferase n=1 Tax=Sphingomonas arvum TaxID=2992113 RepID=A0ABT3JCA5_9SPHN|nr:RNA 2'-phosphotransferase [Sphingomonas sp. BN140010]MCW3796698.1 RNA 2'-phosphotransferase [Sphingomonas sp. BN140010]
MNIRKSKRLAYWLRHAPDAAGLQLDAAGWAPTGVILEALAAQRLPTTYAELEALVNENDKQRFELSEDGNRIRARQGHSITVEGDWPVASPPKLLFHGTTEKFLPAILEDGLLPGARHHVHLSPTVQTARAVGARKGRAVILEIAARRMTAEGFEFRMSSNGVWLADHVPAAYLVLLP